MNYEGAPGLEFGEDDAKVDPRVARGMRIRTIGTTPDQLLMEASITSGLYRSVDRRAWRELLGEYRSHRR